MTKMLLIGDLHGKWTSYTNILQAYQPERSVQLGDFGIGFHPGDTPKSMARLNHAMTQWGPDNRFIRGNHDNPSACQNHPQFIQDATFEDATGIFYLGGAWSIDRGSRIEGKTWWADEELSYQELNAAIDVYERSKPRIVLSHEAPEGIVDHMMPWYRREFRSRTRDAMATMFEIHKPELWIFGHWHSSVTASFDGCQFTCLDELETMEIEI